MENEQTEIEPVKKKRRTIQENKKILEIGNEKDK